MKTKTIQYAGMLESYKLIYDSAKHLTTLNSGLIVVLASFSHNFLDRLAGVSLILMFVAFGCFIWSLFQATAALLIVSHSMWPEDVPSEQGARLFRLMLWAFMLFGLGIILLIVSTALSLLS